MICHFCYSKDIGHNSEPHVWLENIAILDVKGVDCRCVLWNVTKNDAINRLNSFKRDNKGTI